MGNVIFMEPDMGRHKEKEWSLMTTRIVFRSPYMKKILIPQGGCQKESCIRFSQIVSARETKKIWNTGKHIMKIWEERSICMMTGKNSQYLDHFQEKNFMIHVIILVEILRESYPNLMIWNDWGSVVFIWIRLEKQHQTTAIIHQIIRKSIHSLEITKILSGYASLQKNAGFMWSWMGYIPTLGMIVSILTKREITKNQGHIKGKSQSTMIGMTLTKMELIRAGGGLKHCRKSMN